MEIYTSYFGVYRKIPPEYQCISIAHSKPPRLCIPRWDDVLPDWKQSRLFKNDMLEAETFKSCYFHWLNHIGIDRLKSFLEKYKVPVVLLCWEADVNECHRKFLAEYLSSHLNIEINELFTEGKEYIIEID